MPTPHAQAGAFLERHRGPGIIVLPNAWDPGSAVVLAAARFPFVATTSAGIAFAQEMPDGQRLSRSRMLELATRTAAAVDVPVTAGLEAGCAAAELLERGAAGCACETTLSNAAANALMSGAHRGG